MLLPELHQFQAHFLHFSFSLSLPLSQLSLHHFLFRSLFIVIPASLYSRLLSLTPAIPLAPPSPQFGHNASFCGIFYYAAALPRWIPSNWGG